MRHHVIIAAAVATLVAACASDANDPVGSGPAATTTSTTAIEATPTVAPTTTTDAVTTTTTGTGTGTGTDTTDTTDSTGTDTTDSTGTDATDSSAAPSTTSSTMPPLLDCELDAGETTRIHNALDRVVLFAPAEVTVAAPVLVLFHGFAGIFDEFAANTGLLTAAPAAGVHLAVPAGVGTPPTWEFSGGPNDDAGFISSLLDDLADDPCVDPERVWLAGYSAGAGFVGTFACAEWARLDGIVMNAAVAPPLCAGISGLDVIAAHGTADLVVPYGGLPIGGVTLPSSPDLVAEWAALLACAAPIESIDGALTRERWAACGAEANTVEMLTYDGGGHRWPGRDAVGGEGLVVAEPDLTCVVLAAINGADDAVADC